MRPRGTFSMRDVRKPEKQTAHQTATKAIKAGCVFYLNGRKIQNVRELEMAKEGR